MKILFLTPPFQHNIDYPMLAIPSLVSFLRKNGYEVVQKDINVQYMNTLLEKNRLFEVARNIQKQFQAFNSRKALSYFEQKEILTFENLTNGGDYLSKCASNKYNKIRKGTKINDWNEVIHDTTKLAYAEAFGTSMGIYGDGIKTDLANITEFVRKNGSTVFDRFLKNYIQATMLEVEPNVVGISLLTEYQFIPALMVAFSIKKYSPETKVYFGGGYMTATYDKLTSNRNLFSMMDGIFVGEGENALLALLQKLKNGEPLEGIPNFIPDEKTPLFNFHMEDLNKLPAPDFEGLNFHQYAYPQGITLYTSKGCYWGKCAFCSVNEEGPYREKDIEIVLDEIKQLHSKSGIQYITFADDLLNPSRMEIIAKFLIENNLYIKWDCQTRFSRDFTEEFCRLMKKSNNYFIAFGMESANKRILKHIRKGIPHNLMHYVLSNCEKAGLNVIINCMLGFPTETKREADDTLHFPKEIKEKYSSLNIFFNTQITRIERNSDFAKEPEKYGVEISGENELSTSIDWLQPEWVNEPILKEKKHEIFNRSENEIRIKNISIESGSLNLRPKKRYFTMCISSKYNLVKLSSTLIEQSNEIKLFAKSNKVCFREAEKKVTADSIVQPDNNHYHYIIISKIDSRVRSKRFKVSPIVKTVFELCDGKNSIKDIILKVQDIFNTYKMSANVLEKNVVIAINQLLSIGAIFIPLVHKHEKIREIEYEIC